MVKRKLLTLPLIAVLMMISAACAVKNNPQIDRETQWELNTASQLNDLQRDYTTFFTDVGNAQRAGMLKVEQVAVLNSIGSRLKPAIEIANREFKAYMAAPDSSKKAQVISLILEAEKIMLELTSTKANFGGAQ